MVKSSLNGIYIPVQLTDWPLVEVALVGYFGLTHISFDQNQF
jgi:nitrate reductase NapE component